MNFISALSCLSLLLAAAAAQEARPCVSPELMSGGFALMAADGFIMASGSVSYDAYGQRMRVKNYGYAGNSSFEVDQLMLFNEKVYYEIEWSKLSCKKLPLDTTFNIMRVPDDAELSGQIFMGSSSSWGMGVLVNTWSGKLPPNGMYYTVFSEIGCIPMTMAAYYPASGWTTISTFNWVLGNSDPMEYFPPAICAGAKLEETDSPVSVFAALESLARKTQKKE